MTHFVQPDEWNSIIQSNYNFRIFLEGAVPDSYYGHLNSYILAYIEEGKAWATLTIKKGIKEDIYKCALCSDPNYQESYTLVACQQIGRWVKPYIHLIDDKFNQSLPDGPNFRYYNKAYDKKVVTIYSYDVNSAYLYAMLRDWPDTRKPLGPGELEEDEIGFNNRWLYEGYSLTERLVAEFEVGKYCRYRFKKMPCPKEVKKWILSIYQKKAKVSKGPLRDKYKQYLVCLAGMMRNWNTFVRSTFLTISKNYVESLFDENTVYANVDCIYSLTPRNDLPLGDEIGMLKQEIAGEEFIFHGAIHGTNNDPRWSGVPRSWIGNNFIDWVLNDQVPPNQNIYEIDKKTGFIVKRRKE